MIHYTLKCSQDHRFDSWFQSAEAFDKLKASGLVACSICGDTHVDKAMMAPRVRPARGAAVAPEGATSEKTSGPLSQPATELEQALTHLRKQVEANSDYVGMNFAREARAMHDGESPERAIHGEARLDEARALLEDGIPVTPLPFRPGRKSN